MPSNSLPHPPLPTFYQRGRRVTHCLNVDHFGTLQELSKRRKYKLWNFTGVLRKRVVKNKLSSSDLLMRAKKNAKLLYSRHFAENTAHFEDFLFLLLKTK